MTKRILNRKTTEAVGEQVNVMGWVHARRNMGKVVFFDLRDRSGLLQIVCVPSELDEESKNSLDKIRPEYVIKISGTVQNRAEKQINSDLETGAVEVLAKRIEILNECKTPPFEIDKDTSAVNEELRLKYRYLDLRSARMNQNIRSRHSITQSFREFLIGEDFVEIETPVLAKGTPEGAREYLVPSRLHQGKFYVLPQSPQQFKQLLMVSGMERYFQVAKCFRDEDQRGDRQPEFTQVDLEMSFVEREDVMDLVERSIVNTIQKLYPNKKIQQLPFPRIDYKDAMEKYDTDRPDIREDKNDPNLLAFCWVVNFPFFEKIEDGGWTFTHNPFSRAVPEHREWLLNKKNIGEILTTQYDVVLNGFEIGGGSIRNHEAEALRCVFEVMGIGAEEISAKFGHMLEAFEFGAPPHGGLAIGLDRLVAILQSEPNIREIIAFPKTGDARDPMMGAPDVVSQQALKDAHISIDTE
ncbi:MAG: hypothetical protein ACD_76C00094G0034 [uncultured bacterium]|nr:MAG: hypothetical protein ACD_76C00094G0034 [uncultured bacterium]HBD05289.1 aspartate--tRNA ligase [Candidatus Uhrbacteria bacterium]